MNPNVMNRFIAILVWAAGLGTTVAFLRQIGNHGMAETVVAALLVQIILTWLEHWVWHPPMVRVRGGRGDAEFTPRHEPAAWFALFIDTFINIGGTWAVIGTLHVTDAFHALAAGIGFEAGPMPRYISFALSVAVAVLLAIAPERIWNLAGSTPPRARGGMKGTVNPALAQEAMNRRTRVAVPERMPERYPYPGDDGYLPRGATRIEVPEAISRGLKTNARAIPGGGWDD